MGLQVGARDQQVRVGLVALDRSLAVIDQAKAMGADLIVTHHPLFFEPLSTLDTATHTGKSVARLLESGIALVSAHTNWDVAPGGISVTLAECLGVGALASFGDGVAQGASKLVFFCPESNAPAVIDALADAGAGLVGLYRRCAFVLTGTGEFEPLPGAAPAIGTVGRRESVAEMRVEMRVASDVRASVESALRQAHPYEEPAADWYDLSPQTPLRLGRVGHLSEPQSLQEFVQFADEALGTRCLAWGDPLRSVQRVAVSGGAADTQWRAALAAGADVFVTGEVRQHNALEAAESGLAMISAGHYATEHPGCVSLSAHLTEAVPDVLWATFEPAPGLGGRPF